MLNKKEIEKVAERLQEIGLTCYFIGGSIVAIYADNIGTFEQRVTKDIDVVIEVLNRGKYYFIQEQLREAGFKEDFESDVICRWIYDDVLVDIMPNDEKILGFTNRWYADGIKNAIKYKLESGREINVFTFPYFIATKLDALISRGEDNRYSKDFEDIVRLIDNKLSIQEEFENCEPSLLDFITSEFIKLFIQNKNATEDILCVLHPETDKYRADNIIDKVKLLI